MQAQESCEFNVGDRVKFIVLRNPAIMIRVGTVAHVLDPNEHVRDKLSTFSREMHDTSDILTLGSRNHRSYLIEVRSEIPGRKPKIYWPLVKHVLPAQDSN